MLHHGNRLVGVEVHTRINASEAKKRTLCLIETTMSDKPLN
jgi:hypothetical protein